MRRGRKGACELFSRVQATICWGKKTVPSGRNKLHEFRRFSDFLGSKNAQTNFEGIPKSVQNLKKMTEFFNKSAKIVQN